MKGKELEKELKSTLFGYFEKNNFTYKHWYENTYFKKDLQQSQIILEIQSKSQSIGGFTEFGLTIWNIEKIINEIGFPNINEEVLEKWYSYTKTVIDNKFSTYLVRNIESIVENLKELDLFCESIIAYMETEGKAFIEKYLYLPNVLKEMDKLVEEGKYWNGVYGKGGILTGGFDSNFRGLIISKLCNDSNYEKKLDWIESRVSENEKWLPYFEKLKEQLESIEPIYNI